MWSFILVAASASCVLAGLVTVPLRGCSVSSVDQAHSLVRADVYYGQVSVGEQRKSFDLLFDTGSSKLWLPSSFCSDVACELHERYEPRLQLIANETLLGQRAYFATGELVGLAVNDSICLGGSALCASTEILAATEESQFPFIDMPFDGILGLGPSHDGPIRTLQQKGISAFAFQLGTLGQTCGRPAGQVAFGRLEDLPSWALPEGLIWAPLMSQAEEDGYWLLEITSVSMGGHLVQTCDHSPNACRAALDTGTGVMMGPEDVVQPLRQILDIGKECHLGALPKLEFHLRGERQRIFTLTLDPSDYVDASRELCDSLLMPFDFSDRPPLWILGQPLLRKYSVVHDLENRRVGFAATAVPVTPRTARIRERLRRQSVTLV